MAQCVFRNSPGLKKLQQVIWTAGFGAYAGELKATEWLSFDNGAGDTAVDVEITHAKFSPCFVDMGRRTRENTPGQRIG